MNLKKQTEKIIHMDGWITLSVSKSFLRAFLVASLNFTHQNNLKSLFSIMVSHFIEIPPAASP
jgi:hypothetical protein